MRHALLAVVAILLASGLALYLLTDDEAPAVIADGARGADGASRAESVELVDDARSGGSAGLAVAPSDAPRAAVGDAAAANAASTANAETAGPPATVRVVDTSGAPVAAAAVLVHANRGARGEPIARVAADANGVAEIECVPRRFSLVAEAEGFVCVRGLEGTLEEQLATDDAELVLAPAASVSGVVVDHSGAPIEGATVEIRAHDIMDRTTSAPGVHRFGLGGARTRSTSDGAFELGPVAAREHRVVAWASGYTRASVKAQPDGPVRIVLDAGLALTGTVFEADGTPAVGAVVRGGPGQSVGRATTDEGGRYTLTGFDRGERDPNAAIQVSGGLDEPSPYLLVLHDGHAVEVVQPVRPADPPAVQDVRLDPGEVIAGRVLDANDAPVANAKVRVEGSNEVDAGYVTDRRITWEYTAGIADTTTDADGRFAFDRLYAGLWSVQASFPDDRRTVEVETRAGVTDLVVRLDAAALDKVVLTGSVTDAVTGAPVESFRLVPFVGGMANHYDFTDPEGRFRVAGLPPGPIDLKVEADGYASADLGERPYALGTHALEVRMVPTRELVLELSDDGEPPTSSVQVSVLDAAGERRMIPTANGTTNVLWARGPEVGLRGLPAERVTVVATTQDERTARVEIDLRPDVVHTLAIDFAAPTVETPPPTTQVVLWPFVLGDDESADGFEALHADPDDRDSVLTRFVGRYVPASGATVEVLDATGGVVATVVIEVLAPSVERQFPECRIVATWDGGSSTQEGVGAVADVDLEAGRYTLRVSSPGHDDLERTVEVPELERGAWFVPLPLAAD